MLGRVVCGSRTWMCTIAAPTMAASIEDRAISAGVTGTAGFLPGLSAEPVTAQETMTLRCIAPPCGVHPSEGAGLKPAPIGRPRGEEALGPLAASLPRILRCGKALVFPFVEPDQTAATGARFTATWQRFASSQGGQMKQDARHRMRTP
jgi:hypothetical protein